MLRMPFACEEFREIATVYRFARQLDDFIDAPMRPVADKTDLLILVADQLRTSGKAKTAALSHARYTLALDDAVLQHGVRLISFIERIEWDATQRSLNNLTDFYEYYEGIAGVFGDIVCDIFHEPSGPLREAVRANAIRLGILTQLRDIQEDLNTGGRVCGLAEQITRLRLAQAAGRPDWPQAISDHVLAVLELLPPTPTAACKAGGSSMLRRYLAIVESTNAILAARLRHSPQLPEHARLTAIDRMVLAWRFLRS